ncbi:hypothetical protein PG997_012411 [Apiospora hydei]|uniref:DUF6546 domain-containing protein n=1 Tax=Apiospora hydei TaxID=1337664 RepID=A0ABR1V3A7_9PEZI
MKQGLPGTLNTLILFEDSYKFYDSLPNPVVPNPWLSDVMIPYEDLGAVFAQKTATLQQLAIPFMVQAEEIVQRCQPTWSWPRLESLALTSQLLQNDWGTRSDLENLLCRTSVLVQKMPKLQTLVLWNGGKGHACAFIYRVDGGSASITWRGTWKSSFSLRVVEAWQLTASKLPRCPEVEVKQEDITGVIHSHGDAIYHLKLPCQVIDPASLWQIRREAYSSAQ